MVKTKGSITQEFLQKEEESKYFDCKSAKVKATDLAKIFSAFSNAEGGTVAVGVSDKKRRIEGLKSLSQEAYNQLLAAPKDYCMPMPICEVEKLEVVNEKGEEDFILLFHIEVNNRQIIRTQNGSTYLRIGDKSKELKGEDLLNLEYARNTRRYEDEKCAQASIEDLNEELLEAYKQKIGAVDTSTEQVLQARGFLIKDGEKYFLSNAAVLLFAKDTLRFFPQCRVRIIRYEGEKMTVGYNMNIVKDINVELPLLQIIEKVKEQVIPQLRDFMALERNGKFYSVSEYPEFAWLEGVVNAVTHREYAREGNYIKISLFDDRMEIESPGKLPNIVTIENIKETRYSRNPRIARVLNDMGWVRELNEGVKRIYEDMEKFFLDEPEYTETNEFVKLTLKNNYIMRNIRRESYAIELLSDKIWGKLSKLEQQMMIMISNRGEITRQQLEKYTGKSASTMSKKLSNLIDMGLVRRIGETNDPRQTYRVKKKV